MGDGFANFMDFVFGVAEKSNEQMEKTAKQKMKDPNLTDAQRQRCQKVAEDSREKRNQIRDFRENDLRNVYGSKNNDND